MARLPTQPKPDGGMRGGSCFGEQKEVMLVINYVDLVLRRKAMTLSINNASQTLRRAVSRHVVRIDGLSRRVDKQDRVPSKTTLAVLGNGALVEASCFSSSIGFSARPDEGHQPKDFQPHWTAPGGRSTYILARHTPICNTCWVNPKDLLF
ncbi:hypothetical protein AOQ84DRAFT_416292 [Glonium stellatum]|uniref:Uncharacterized protein n=1 Tax=Glonium stellatum TaxID=574774 RepID=A0A8E2ET71_9PEZI|nr:hypothetical protein AOQ84DRAFT_416292 [Glonium stellatum]